MIPPLKRQIGDTVKRDKIQVLLWNYLDQNPIKYDEFGPVPQDILELATFLWQKGVRLTDKTLPKRNQ